MKYLGIDYGSKKVGIAVSDDSANLAFPKYVITNDTELLEHIARIVSEESIEAIVLGESRDFKGKENPIMKDIKDFKNTLEERLALPVYLEPEFFTSREAARIPHASDEPRSRKQKKHTNRDDSAAALILQRFLEKQQQSRTQ